MPRLPKEELSATKIRLRLVTAAEDEEEVALGYSSTDAAINLVSSSVRRLLILRRLSSARYHQSYHHIKQHKMKSSASASFKLLLLAMIIIASSLSIPSTLALSSSFLGSHIRSLQSYTTQRGTPSSVITMRKQKASDKRTARMQRGQIDTTESSFTPPSLSTATTTTQILSSSPMSNSKWKDKKIELLAASGQNMNSVTAGVAASGGGRGRARKRLKLYNSLASYHSTFLELISAEYQMEVSCKRYASV